MSSPRALGGGLAAPAPTDPETHVRTYADTCAAVRVYVRDMQIARGERARGEERLAERREQGAKRLLDTHERHLRAQRGEALAEQWMAAARREAEL